MEWLKTILDRLSWILGSLIPGSVLFLLFFVHHPALVRLIWETQILTYGTKLFLTVLFTFAVGHTVNFGFTTLLGAIAGAVGGYLGAAPDRWDAEAAPWQNRTWRALLHRYLGPVAPENIDPPHEEVYAMRLEAIQKYPVDQRAQMAKDLLTEKTTATLNDYQWRGWWEYFHRSSFLTKSADVLLYDHINSGFCAASLVVLFALPSTPQLRLWWIVAICVFWVLFLILRCVADFRSVMDPWSSYFKQIERLEKVIGDLTNSQNP